MTKGKRIVRPEEVETQMFDWGNLKWMSEPRITDAVRFSAGVVILESGKGHSSHNHPGVEEILYCISGEGEQSVEDEKQPLVPGMLVHIPPGVFHETYNTGWEQLKLLAIYSPPGPEKEFATFPDCTVLPPGKLPIK
ncbi:cupin domain-containing protein [Pelosinus sp. sgz500959]|uniref:cupin domain-containing protein n=1 Tax=Pelosinus sp. sgz500959 TaxID=3242472 RepID=UPI00366BB3CE